MSGTEYVWLILGQEGEPLVVFDTKYSLIHWLRGYSPEHLYLLSGYRMRTGTWSKKAPVPLDLEVVKNEKPRY